MKYKIMLLFSVLLINLQAKAQDVQRVNSNPAAIQPANSIDAIALEMTKISKSLATFNKRLKELLDQFALNKNNQLNERQQKLLLGFEILNRAEQRLEILQKFQIELVEKEVVIKTRLFQNEQEMRPDTIDRGIAFVGTTRTEEIRDNRRRTLDTERNSLQNLFSQIQRNQIQTTNELRQAETLVINLRKKILPQIEMEISDLWKVFISIMCVALLAASFLR